MLTKIQKWGNSMAVRIPKAFAEEMQISAETAVELRLEDGKLIVEPVDRPTYLLAELLAQVSDENLHTEVDWGELVGQEAW